MMFDYATPMPTEDNVVVLGGGAYPWTPHMKAFKWRPDLGYTPYIHNAKITQYRKSRYHAKTKIQHFCLYKQEWREKKVAHIRRCYGEELFKSLYKTV